MEISLDKTDKNEGLIKISLKEADYQPAVDQKVKDYRKKANIKGFRPGKVPESMIRSMYGKSLVVEEINRLVGQKLSSYLKESETNFLGEPLPNREKSDNIDWETQKDFEFEYNIGFANDFDLKIDRKLKTERYKIKIDDTVLKETVENLQRQFGEPKKAEIIEEKDFVYGSVVSSDESINKELKIDMRELEKGAWKKFRSCKGNDKVSITPKKLYKSPNLLKHQLGLTDEEYKKIKGKLAITVQKIERITEAPVDQTLFDKTFGEGAVDSLDSFNEKVKVAVSKNYASEESQFFNFKLSEQLIEKAKIVLPDNFLKNWLKGVNEEMTDEILEKEYSTYARELRWSLIRNYIVKNKSIEIDNEEVLQEAKTLIRNQFAASGVGEGLEDQLAALAINYLQAENGDNYMKVFGQVQNRKVMDFIESEATIKDKEVSLEAFRKLAQ